MYDSIQNLRAFSQKVFDAVEEYLSDNQYTLSDGEGVYIDNDKEVSIILEVEAEDKANYYPIQTLVRDGDDGKLEADGDAIDEVASHYFFVR